MAEFGGIVELSEQFNAGTRLTKRRFASGTRCAKRLWLETHEPEAPELAGQQIPTVLLEQGRKCGELARQQWPDGRLVGDGRVAAFDLERAARETRELMHDGARVLFEAVFLCDHAVAIVDVLERMDDGWRLIEVKQANECHDEYVADVAFQLHVLESCGVTVREASVMHLNRDCAHPALETLFLRQDVTDGARALVADIGLAARAMFGALGSSMPETAIHLGCISPEHCTFKARCWEGVPSHHVSSLYRMKKADAIEHHHAGRMRIVDLELPPAKKKPSATWKIQWRQQEALQRGERIVEREGLSSALSTLRYPLAMLDFETVQLAVPVWPGCTPQTQVPVQFSCHVIPSAGAEALHHAWIARGPDDPRRPITEALIAACQDAATIMAYYSPFEEACLKRLAAWLPDRSDEIMYVHDRIVDLLPIVRDHVYDPAFEGSFSIKKVLPALVPSLSYSGLKIGKGDVASSELYRVMFGGETVTDSERAYVTDALLEYCKLDTHAMVMMHRALVEMV